jgi:NADPH-dependent F420 reductase
MAKESILLTVALLGGTGKEGKGLAYRWAKAGYRVLIGSRSPEKAVAVATELLNKLESSAFIDGTSNIDAAAAADIVVLTVPYSAHSSTLESIKEVITGKILVDVTVPLVPPKVTKAQMPPAGSAAQEAKNILGKNVEVTSAFQNISYEHLLRDELPACDVLVTGTSKTARDETLKLVAAAGFVGWDAGPIENSMVVEGMTSVLININKAHGSTNAGIKITGIH